MTSYDQSTMKKVVRPDRTQEHHYKIRAAAPRKKYTLKIQIYLLPRGIWEEKKMKQLHEKQKLMN